jgi:hypothetical protein
LLAGLIVLGILAVSDSTLASILATWIDIPIFIVFFIGLGFWAIEAAKKRKVIMLGFSSVYLLLLTSASFLIVSLILIGILLANNAWRYS